MKNATATTAPSLTNRIFAEAFVCYIEEMNDKNWEAAMKVLPEFQADLNARKKFKGCATIIENEMNYLKTYNGCQCVSWDSINDVVAILIKTGLEITF